jgi:Cytochrome b5-like Heme/Steroid binding domain
MEFWDPTGGGDRRETMLGLRKQAAVSLVIFAVAVGCVLTAGLMSSCGDGGSTLSQTPTGVAARQPTGSGASVVLSAAEVAKHNSSSDCWLIIENKVYDVSKYLISHPGGRAVIIQYCGTEATHAFETVNHSRIARIHLDSIYLGDLAP